MSVDVTPSRHLQRVVAPVVGQAVDSRHAAARLRPANVGAGVAVELHPAVGEVPELAGVLHLWVGGGRERGALHRHIDAGVPDAAHLLGPGKGVFHVKNQDETGAGPGVLLPPPLDDLVQLQGVTAWWIM